MIPLSKLSANEYVVFICYRRDDAAWAAGRIDDFLTTYFNKAKIFRDVREIEIGNKFPDKLMDALEKSKVLIVVIGKNWLTALDDQGLRKIDNPGDWVRTEIATAIKSEATIIPVLIDKARMPKKEDLPEDIQELVKWQALSLEADTFRHGMLTLRKYLQEVEELEENQDLPQFDEIREKVIEDLLHSDEYRYEREYIKDILSDEIIREYYEDQMADMYEDER